VPQCWELERFVGRVQDDYAQEDEEYKKLKKETVVLFFLAT